MKFPLLDNLTRQLARFPGVGPKSALRMAYHLLEKESYETEQLAQALLDFRHNIGVCEACGCLAQDNQCPICADSRRDHDQYCVVEKTRDLLTIEKTGHFRGQYHVLGGALSPLDGIGPEDLRIPRLLERLKNQSATGHPPQELILATNPTLEGDATARFLAGVIAAEFPEIRVSRIAHGLQTGGELEFADTSTLIRSLKDRRLF